MRDEIGLCYIMNEITSIKYVAKCFLLANAAGQTMPVNLMVLLETIPESHDSVSRDTLISDISPSTNNIDTYQTQIVIYV